MRHQMDCAAIAVLLFGMLMAGVSAQSLDGSDDSLQNLDSRRIQIVRRAFIDPRISDPNSLEFKKVYVSDMFNVCGYVKYRDRYGRYTKFVPFYVDPSSHLVLMDPSLILVETTRIKIKQACRSNY